MSTFANVYVGAAPNDGTGDPLRTAFLKIDQNFANIAAMNPTANVVVYASGNANVFATYNPGVSSVAGRTGNVVLAVNDVLGAASNVYARSYTMGNSANWNAEVNTVGTALDELAQRLRDAGF